MVAPVTPRQLNGGGGGQEAIGRVAQGTGQDLAHTAEDIGVQIKDEDDLDAWTAGTPAANDSRITIG